MNNLKYGILIIIATTIIGLGFYKCWEVYNRPKFQIGECILSKHYGVWEKAEIILITHIDLPVNVYGFRYFNDSVSRIYSESFNEFETKFRKVDCPKQ